ncbi:hypothetical protein RJT34_23302 [Clitoria ternatea]|uniref:Uncharacterized protein n=1 Tax=Clitoria ternatea TaxID=43366 RepID=A0AAN9IL16_CLITE
MWRVFFSGPSPQRGTEQWWDGAFAVRVVEMGEIAAVAASVDASRMVGIAQLVEQRTENPRVTSSNLVPGI